MSKGTKWLTCLLAVSLIMCQMSAVVSGAEVVEQAAESPSEEAPAELPAEEAQDPAEQTEKETVSEAETSLPSAEEHVKVQKETEPRYDDLFSEGTSDLWEQYAQKLFYGSTAPAPSVKLKAARNTGARLTGQDRVIYDAIRTAAAEIADGQRASSIVEVSLADLGVRSGEENGYTAAELGLEYIYDWETEEWNPELEDKIHSLLPYDFSKIKACLMADCPYEFYWASGETKHGDAGYSTDGDYLFFTTDRIAFRFTVESKYRADAADPYSVNTELTGQASAAKACADRIIAEAAGKTDTEKLLYYKEKICDLVVYNRDAAAHSDTYEDRGPWALIYVFDEDPDTNVVCEGYSEAFQYLCDHTDFASSRIKVYCVTGTMNGGTGAGAHKWNIVHMDDGYNYIADITNSDEGSVGSDGKLFLKGMSGNVADGYSLSWEKREESVTNPDGSISTTIYPAGSISYTYDKETKALYSDTDLTLSALDYGQNTPVEEPEPASLYGASLRLTGDIGVNFYYEFTDEMLGDPGAAVQVTVGEGAAQTFSLSDAAIDTTSVSGKTLYKFTCYVAAKQMKDQIVVQALGTDYAEEPHTYSIRKYADNILAKETSSAELKYLVRVMMLYGANAQAYLNYNTANPADAGLDNADVTDAAEALTPEDLSAYQSSKTEMPEGITLYGANLSLKSETVLRFHFELQEGHDISEYTFQVNGAGGYTPVLKNGRYCIEINNVRAQDLDVLYTVTVSDGSGNSGSVTYGAMTYVRNILKAGTDKYSQALIDTCRSLCLYNRAAEAYLAVKGR